IKIGPSVLIIGFNTNGDLNSQATVVNGILQNSSNMQNVKTVALVSHKPCYTSPNSHHPVESKVKAFCDSLNVPAGVKVLYIAGHNHQLASTADGTKFISGGGGKSHYDCGTDNTWTFCDNKHYGYLELTVDNAGNTVTKFVN